jgi:hypothetical protein
LAENKGLEARYDGRALMEEDIDDLTVRFGGDVLAGPSAQSSRRTD